MIDVKTATSNTVTTPYHALILTFVLESISTVRTLSAAQSARIACHRVRPDPSPRDLLSAPLARPVVPVEVRLTQSPPASLQLPAYHAILPSPASATGFPDAAAYWSFLRDHRPVQPTSFSSRCCGYPFPHTRHLIIKHPIVRPLILFNVGRALSLLDPLVSVCFTGSTLAKYIHQCKDLMLCYSEHGYAPLLYRHLADRF